MGHLRLKFLLPMLLLVASAPGLAKDLWRLELLTRQAASLEKFLNDPGLIWDYEKAVTNYTYARKFGCDEFSTVIDEVRKLSEKVPGFSKRLWEKTDKMPTLTFKERPAPEKIFTRTGVRMVTHPIRASYQLTPVTRRLHGIWLQEAFERCQSNMCTERDRAKPSRWALAIKGSQLFVLEQGHKYQNAAVLVVPVEKEGKTVALVQAIGSPILLKRKSFFTSKKYQDANLVEMLVAELWKRKPKEWSSILVLKNLDEAVPKQLKSFTQFITPDGLAHLQDGREVKPTDKLAAQVANEVERKCYQASTKKGADLLFTTAGIVPGAPTYTILNPGGKKGLSEPILIGSGSSMPKAGSPIGPKSSAVYKADLGLGEAQPYNDEKDESAPTVSQAAQAAQPSVQSFSPQKTQKSSSGLENSAMSEGPTDRANLPSFSRKGPQLASIAPAPTEPRKGDPNHQNATAKTPSLSDSERSNASPNSGMNMLGTGTPSPSGENPLRPRPKDEDRADATPRDRTGDPRDPRGGGKGSGRDEVGTAPPGDKPKPPPQEREPTIKELLDQSARKGASIPEKIATRAAVTDKLRTASDADFRDVAQYALDPKGSFHRDKVLDGLQEKLSPEEARKVGEGMHRAVKEECELQNEQNQKDLEEEVRKRVSERTDGGAK